LQQRPARRFSNLVIIGLAAFVIVLVATFVVHARHHSNELSPPHTSTASNATSTAATSQSKPPVQKSSICASNTISQAVYVSISQRHLWACNDTTQAYDSAVVTGMENIPADLTPTGTYHIYAKQADLYLDGSDSTGSWHDHVYYWMPFLTNQYGVYGFHDATWRQPNDFGNISPYTTNASHGCVELPLSTAKWVYNWASVGTTVVIQS
jgi:lipoprotein-anchoring transpeptidase ErfK/SrfK